MVPGVETGQDAEKLPAPDWVAASANWPDTIRWVFDSTFELTTDGLFVRIRPEVGLDATTLNFPGQRPLISRTFVTMRPITVWAQAQGFKLDSLVVYDPVKKKVYPGQPLLSMERGYTENTVRTTFLPNLAILQEPELDEGQPIEVTMYMTWDRRTIISTFPALPTRYLRGSGDW
jgi:hypothetical protein